jgi:putative oxidoreductase
MKTFIRRFYGWLIIVGNGLRSPFLFLIRLYWGWQLFQTGKGKLMDLSKPTQFFESLHIPFPHFSAVLVGSTEAIGGLLLLVGFASRLVSVPLMISLTVAYLTADLSLVKNIFNDPDKFLAADEFLFLFAVLIVFIFGPGKFSLDWLIQRKLADSPRV